MQGLAHHGRTPVRDEIQVANRFNLDFSRLLSHELLHGEGSDLFHYNTAEVLIAFITLSGFSLLRLFLLWTKSCHGFFESGFIDVLSLVKNATQKLTSERVSIEVKLKNVLELQNECDELAHLGNLV